jgi:hypothetical protein
MNSSFSLLGRELFRALLYIMSQRHVVPVQQSIFNVGVRQIENFRKNFHVVVNIMRVFESFKILF